MSDKCNAVYLTVHNSMNLTVLKTIKQMNTDKSVDNKHCVGNHK